MQKCPYFLCLYCGGTLLIIFAWFGGTVQWREGVQVNKTNVFFDGFPKGNSWEAPVREAKDFVKQNKKISVKYTQRRKSSGKTETNNAKGVPRKNSTEKVWDLTFNFFVLLDTPLSLKCYSFWKIKNYCTMNKITKIINLLFSVSILN